jgi:hypothetical protein
VPDAGLQQADKPRYEAKVHDEQLLAKYSADDIKAPPLSPANSVTNLGSSQPAAKMSVLCLFMAVVTFFVVALLAGGVLLPLGLGYGNAMVTPVDNATHSLSVGFDRIACNSTTMAVPDRTTTIVRIATLSPPWPPSPPLRLCCCAPCLRASRLKNWRPVRSLNPCHLLAGLVSI